MSAKNKPERLPSSAWMVATLRLTAFPSDVAPLEDIDWWQALTGDPPAVTETHPRVATREDRGPFADGTLTLRISPSRIDWLLTPQLPKQGLPTGYLTLGPAPDVQPPFIELMHRWVTLDTIPRIGRVAFGADLVHFVPDRLQGYRVLTSYLHQVSLDPEHSTDFLYQINRPRQSTSHEGLSINRLEKWAVGVFELVAVSTDGVTPQSSEFACRLDLDINTSPQYAGPIPPDGLPPLLDELAGLADQILTEGDIP